MVAFRMPSRPLRSAWAAFAVVVGGLALPAPAGSLSDHWHDPSDPGWGVAVTHQGDVLFVVLADYVDSLRDAEQRPLPFWHVMPEMRQVSIPVGGADASPSHVVGYQGDVYRTAGASAVASPGGPKVTRVGSATFVPGPNDAQASFEYTIDGQRTVRALRRLGIAPLPLAGTYLVSLSALVVMDQEGACEPGIIDRRETWMLQPLAAPQAYRLRRVGPAAQVEDLDAEIVQAGSIAIAAFRSENWPVAGRWVVHLDHAGAGGLAGTFAVGGDGIAPTCRATGRFTATRKLGAGLF